MKVTAFIGSARKKHTYKAAEQLLKNMQAFGDVEYELVQLSDYNLEVCKGCKLCCDRGEELCPLKDDRDKLIEKMDNSDGVIFASPNYSFQLSGMMKVFIDKFGFIIHRPRFFGKAFTSVVAQGVYGGHDILKYLNFVGMTLGFNTVKGSCITTLEPMSENQKKKNDDLIAKQSKQFYARLVNNSLPKPGLFDLMMFRMSRTRIQIVLDESFRDYTYYREQGWFKSDFFYPVKLNPVKKLLGKFFDWVTRKTTKKPE